MVSCIRRNLFDVCTSFDTSAYSDYELADDSEFRGYIGKYNLKNRSNYYVLDGLPFVYCFKDAYTKISGQNNQVHSRALHAEERALAAVSKSVIKGGYLFTTSSPCDMCSKRVKEAEIDTVYYIEPYPGIAETNVTNSGLSNNRAKYLLFQGAIGRAYNQLYAPVIPLKDELDYRGVAVFERQ